MSGSSRCPTVIESRSRSSRAAAPIVRAPSLRRRGRSTTDSRRCSAGPTVRRSPPLNRVLLHIVARGKIGRSPEADLVDRYLKRITWATKVTELPDRGGKVPDAGSGAVIVVLDERGEALTSMQLAKA